MNIFLPYKDIQSNVEALDDKRLNKMILEHAQLMATAVNLSGGQCTYKSTHKNHPCAIFCRETKGNYSYVLEYFLKMCSEYCFRTGKVHKCSFLRDEFIDGMQFIPAGPLTEFKNCTPHKEIPIHDAYKTTLVEKWKNDTRPPKWTKRDIPEFYR